MAKAKPKRKLRVVHRNAIGNAAKERQALIKLIREYPAWQGKDAYKKLVGYPTSALDTLAMNLNESTRLANSDNPFKCGACGQEFADEHKLMDHVDEIHGGLVTAINMKRDREDAAAAISDEARLRRLASQARATCADLENISTDLSAGHVRTARLAINWILHNLAGALHQATN